MIMMMASNSNLVQESDQVVFMRPGSTRIFQVRKNRQVYFEKNKFHVEELIGQPYGTTYEIQNGKLVKVTATKSKETDVDANVSEPTGDNRNLLDLDSNQKMSRDDIMDLKGKGLTGEEIIEELVENSETFHNKTEFSKAKYLKKKKKRHILSFTVLRPTPRLVMNIFSKEPGKICNLRPDTLSQLLSYSNVMYGSNVAVVENCQGLVLASVLQRLGGKGILIQLIPNSSTNLNRQVMNYFSFSKEEMDNVYVFQMESLSNLKKAVVDEDGLESENLAQVEEMSLPSLEEAPKEDMEMGKESKSDDPVPEIVEKMDSAPPCDVEDASKVAEGVEDASKVAEGVEDASKGIDGVDNGDQKSEVSYRLQQRAAKEARHKEAARIIRSKNIDSLIIACKYNPLEIVKNMLEFMPPSKHVVVFCQYIDPLVSIYTYIKDQHLGLQVQLSETWLRDYQVLPQRTHPVINMSGTGGYLLTFITCNPTKDID